MQKTFELASPSDHHTFERNGMSFVVPVLNPSAVQVVGAPRELYEPLPVNNQRRGLNFITLHVTEKCNFSCRYCFVAPNSRRNLAMSLETAKQAVRLIYASSEDRVAIRFFGGEPLLNFELIEEVVSYAEKLMHSAGKSISFNIFTNGALLRPEHVDFFEKHPFTVFLSIDGTEDTHDKLRPFRGGAGSYRLVSQKAKLLLERIPYRVLARAIVDPRDRVVSLVEVAEGLIDLGFLFISLEVPWVDSNSRFALDAASTERLKDEFTRLADVFLDRTLHKKTDFFGLHQFGGLLRHLTEGISLDTYSCGAGAEMVAVSTDGALYPCHAFVGMEQFKIGHVTLEETDHAIREQFIRYGSETISSCQTCWARFLCRKRCPFDAYLFTGDLWSPNPYRCDLERHIVELTLYIYHSLKQNNPKMLEVFRWMVKKRLKIGPW